jgi:phosphoribosyl-ATP pyrophosphohydrolase/phosphoribosyl-AMP cyclohydrolase
MKATMRHSVTCAAAVQDEQEIQDMPEFLDSIKWDSNNLAVAIAQHIDTGEVLMQAFVDRNAVNETLQTGYVCVLVKKKKGALLFTWRR